MTEQSKVSKRPSEQLDYIGSYRLWSSLLLVVFVVTLVRGVRFPNMWSYSHYLFNYDYDFVKRGLLGTLISSSRILQYYDAFYYLSLVLLIINAVLIYRLVTAMLRSSSFTFSVVAFLFATSQSLVYLAHLIGYADQIGLLLVMISLSIKNFNWQIALITPLFGLALFVHEGLFILFYPVILFSTILRLEIVTKKHAAMILLQMLLLLVLTGLMANATLPIPAVEQMKASLQTITPYHLRDEAFEVLSTSSIENLKMMAELWTQRGDVYPSMISSLILTVPLIIIFMILTFRILGQAKLGEYIKILAVFGALSPLLMHLVGWDRVRWNNMAVFTSFITLYIVFDKFGTRRVRDFLSYEIAIICGVCFLNVSASAALMDERKADGFPFKEKIRYISEVFKGTREFPEVTDKY